MGPQETGRAEAVNEPRTRDDSWLRRKDPDEKWPRFAAEIPPELAELLDAAQRKSMGVNSHGATRAGMVRAGLRLYLNTVMPEPEQAVEGTAEDITDVLALEEGR